MNYKCPTRRLCHEVRLDGATLEKTWFGLLQYFFFLLAEAKICHQALEWSLPPERGPKGRQAVLRSSILALSLVPLLDRTSSSPLEDLL